MSPATEQSSFKTSDFRVLASGLQYPEGPIWRPDGSVLLVEIKGGTLTRILPDGTKQVVAATGGGPNGAAIGPDGAVYIANDGGLEFLQVGNLLVAADQAATYGGGSIQRVDSTGKVTTLYTSCQVANPFTHQTETHALCAPDDLVFDSAGGFWFTDWGHSRNGGRERDVTGVYYAKPDGSSIQEKIFPLYAPNGIALSPDEKRLYVAETYSRRVLYWELTGPGAISPNPRSTDGSYVLANTAGILDSMDVDENGNVYAVTMLPRGLNFASNGGLTVISPRGEILEFIEIAVGEWDPLPSNLCFGGPDRRTAYITMGGSGRLVVVSMRVPGKKPAFV